MNEASSLSYYLGGNTADGFYSLYDSFTDPGRGDFLWVIKGGAGCGKSSLMRMIGAAAERGGHSVEYVLCSGDPESLDGIYIPELKTAYMDGTAPHLADVRLAAVDSAYLDLGKFYDMKAISERREELLSLKDANSRQYKKAYSLLCGAGAIRRGWLGTLSAPGDREAAERRMEGLLRRELGSRRRTGGKAVSRFLSAISCRGRRSLPETAEKLCDRFCVLESKLGLDGLMLELSAREAVSRGYEVVICPDPLTPEKPEAVLIPDVGLGFVSASSGLSGLSSARKIHLDPKGESATRKRLRGELGRLEKLSASLESEAIAALASAKAYHDILEKIYNPNVDFDGVYEVTARHIAALGLK